MLLNILPACHPNAFHSTQREWINFGAILCSHQSTVFIADLLCCLLLSSCCFFFIHPLEKSQTFSIRPETTLRTKNEYRNTSHAGVNLVYSVICSICHLKQLRNSSSIWWTFFVIHRTKGSRMYNAIHCERFEWH